MATRRSAGENPAAGLAQLGTCEHSGSPPAPVALSIGVDGGASNSTLVVQRVCDGSIVARGAGPGLNPWTQKIPEKPAQEQETGQSLRQSNAAEADDNSIDASPGLLQVAATVVALVEDALHGLGYPFVVEVIGLAISGIATSETGETLAAAVQQTVRTQRLAAGAAPGDPFKGIPDGAFDRIVVTDDVLASLRAVLPRRTDGILLISGTGSNCLYHRAPAESSPPRDAGHNQTRPDEPVDQQLPRVQCGGGGHFLGDEGSAWDIAIRTMRKVFMIDEGRADVDDDRWTPSDVAPARLAIFLHFGLTGERFQKRDLYPLLYGPRACDKKRVAALTSTLARLASSGNKFCGYQFYCAGRVLAEHVAGVLRTAQRTVDQHPFPSTLPVVCVGSVFKSWELLEQGFQDVLSKRLHSLNMESCNLIFNIAGAGPGVVAIARESLGLPLVTTNVPFQPGSPKVAAALVRFLTCVSASDSAL